ncbi:unnamed protein product [Rhodiola kirilowii]
MSALVCRKRCFFEDIPTPNTAFKRVCYSSSSRYLPHESSLNSQRLAAVERLMESFPGTDKQLIERVLDACRDDLDSAIRSLNELRIGSTDVCNTGKINGQLEPNSQHEIQADNGETEPPKGQSAQKNIPADETQWVELFVSEMTCASSMDDARARASRALEVLKKSIVSRAGVEAAQQENAMLKEQIQSLVQENSILKRAVAIQHQKQKDYEDKTRELEHLKQVTSQYQEQLRTLEMNNYALGMHLKQAQQTSPIISGRFNPDVF